VSTATATSAAAAVRERVVAASASSSLPIVAPTLPLSPTSSTINVALDDDDHTARVQSLWEPTKTDSNDDAAASKDATTTTTTAQSQTPLHIEEPHPQHIELGLFGRCDDGTYVPLPMVSDHSATGPIHSANHAGGSLLTSLRPVTGTVTNTASTNPTISKASCIAVRTLTNEPAPLDCQFQWFKNT
jgi:hypothetical protein